MAKNKPLKCEKIFSNIEKFLKPKNHLKREKNSSSMEKFLKPEKMFSSVNGMAKITKIKSQKLRIDSFE